MKKTLLILTLLVALHAQCFGWGQKGHDTTCAIAQNHLTDKAKTAISNLLDGKSIVYWANWLDNASNTPEYAYSKTWHYKNIDAGQTFEEAPLLGTGDVVTALTEQTFNIRTALKNNDKAAAALSLKMIVHLMGDLHQPMHMGHKSDLGGNRWAVNFFRTETNLHSVWDTNLVESAHKWSHSEWRDEIDRLTETEIEDINKGDYTEWAKQTFELATKVYDETPAGSTLSYDYVRTWTPTVEQQFLRGGIRLARVLNEIFE